MKVELLHRISSLTRPATQRTPPPPT